MSPGHSIEVDMPRTLGPSARAMLGPLDPTRAAIGHHHQGPSDAHRKHEKRDQEHRQDGALAPTPSSGPAGLIMEVGRDEEATMRSLTRLGQRRELTGTTYQLTDCLHHGHSAGRTVRTVVLPSQPAGPVHPLSPGGPRAGAQRGRRHGRNHPTGQPHA